MKVSDVISFDDIPELFMLFAFVYIGLDYVAPIFDIFADIMIYITITIAGVIGVYVCGHIIHYLIIELLGKIQTYKERIDGKLEISQRIRYYRE